jgi:hypothetical protein
MSPIQTTGKAAAGVVDALKGQPLILALIIVTFSMIGLLYYQATIFNSQRADNVKLFVQMQVEVQKLLSQCIVPAPPDRRSGSDAPHSQEGPT